MQHAGCPALRGLVALVPGLLWQPAGAIGNRAPAAAPQPMAVVAGEPIVIDGRLDERTWEQAAIISEFVQREPSEGLAPSFGTEARVAFDDGALYVGDQGPG